MLTWVARFDHSWAPVESEETAAAIADIVQRECFSACSRVSYARSGSFGRPGRNGGYKKKNAAIVREYILDARNESVHLDNGRQGELTASMRFATGAVRREGIPLFSYLAMPLSDDVTALEEAACDLAGALRVHVGAIAVFPVYRWAEKFGYSSDLMDDRAREMGLSERRHQEWNAWSNHRLARQSEIAGPEWGLFLSSGHLAKLPASVIRASGAFAEVRELEGDRAFLRLTDDPRDALAPDYEARLDKARDALRPILADPAWLA